MITVYGCNNSRKNIANRSKFDIYFVVVIGFIQLRTVRLEDAREYFNAPMVLHERYISYLHKRYISYSHERYISYSHERYISYSHERYISYSHERYISYSHEELLSASRGNTGTQNHKLERSLGENRGVPGYCFGKPRSLAVRKPKTVPNLSQNLKPKTHNLEPQKLIPCT